MKELFTKLISVITIILLLYVFYDIRKEKNIDKPTNEIKIEEKKDLIDENLKNSLINKLPKIFYCDDYPMTRIYQTNIVYEKDIDEEAYNDDYDNCQSYYILNRKVEEGYKIKGVIYIEEYILLYDKNKDLFGTSYNNFFDINPENIVDEEGKIKDEIYYNYGKKYKHTFKTNSLGEYNWYSTNIVE